MTMRLVPGGRQPPLPAYDRALHAPRTWLDSWSGIGHAAVGMHRQGFDLQSTQYDERGWRATFYVTGMEHSPGRPHDSTRLPLVNVWSLGHVCEFPDEW